MQAEQRASAPRRCQPTVSSESCPRWTPFTVAEDARRADSGLATTQNLGNVGSDDENWLESGA
jgi:hypothetical protein